MDTTGRRTDRAEVVDGFREDAALFVLPGLTERGADGQPRGSAPSGGHRVVPIDRSASLRRRAAVVATILDVLASLACVVGALASVALVVLGALGRLPVDAGLGSLLLGLAGAAAVVVCTALVWAGLSLATVVAGYIAVRGEFRSPQGPAQPQHRSAGPYPLSPPIR